MHEARVETLRTVADLAGYAVTVRLDGHVVPDLVRLHPSSPGLLVADAKATESPSCAATRARLARYSQHCRDWCAAGFQVTLMICHDTDTCHAWLRCLRGVTSAASLRTSIMRVSRIDADTWLSSVNLDPDQQCPIGPPPRLPLAPPEGHPRAVSQHVAVASSPGRRL
jgi:hypothetical protein